VKIRRQDQIAEWVQIWDVASRVVVGDTSFIPSMEDFAVDDDRQIETMNRERDAAGLPHLSESEELEWRVGTGSKAATAPFDALEDERATSTLAIRQRVLQELIALQAYESSARCIAKVDADEREPLARAALNALVARRKITRARDLLNEVDLPENVHIGLFIRAFVLPHRLKLIREARKQIEAFEKCDVPSVTVSLLVLFVFYAGAGNGAWEIERAHRLIRKIRPPEDRIKRLVDLARVTGNLAFYREAAADVDARTEHTERMELYRYLFRAVRSAANHRFAVTHEAASLGSQELRAIRKFIQEERWREEFDHAVGLSPKR
jgi:hypothetical protein